MNPPQTVPSIPMNRDAIEHFVRDQLGCSCPDSVFRSIVLGRGDPGPGVPAHSRLLVGDRLLIHVLDAAATRDLARDVAALASAGLAERDRAGYNRFRLVAVLEPDSPDAAAAEAAFAAAVGGDTRAHLHCLGEDAIPGALLAAARKGGPMPGG